jgi:hypothetical protein
MYPHCIRLREPWTKYHTDDDGTQYLERGFHRPTISGGERVWLVCEKPNCGAVVFLDDRKLGVIQAGEGFWSWDVTERLLNRHNVKFQLLEWPSVWGEEGSDELPWHEVRLEIRLHSSPQEGPT